MFCGEYCRKTATNLYHEMECKILPSLLSLGRQEIEFLAVRIFLQASEQGRNFDKLMGHPFYKNPFSKGDSNEMNWSTMYKTNNYFFIHNLADNFEKLPMSEKLERSFMAVLLLSLLKQNDFFSHNTTDNDSSAQLTSTENYAGALMLKHLLAADMNAHWIGESETSVPSTGCNQHLGSTIYPFLSYLNHSCDYNAQKMNYGTDLALYAVQPILAGEQVQIMMFKPTYIDIHFFFLMRSKVLHAMKV